VVLEHGEEPVRGRAGDADRRARLRDPEVALLPQQVEQLESVVDRLDGVGGGLRNTVLHSRNSIAGAKRASSGPPRLPPVWGGWGDARDGGNGRARGAGVSRIDTRPPRRVV